MSARTISPGNPQAPPPRFDRQFIEDHRLVERYLEGKLPMKGARDLENWCRRHPEFLDELNLTERARASIKLLEAAGQPQDLAEAPIPWWKTIYVPIGLGVAAFLSLVAFSVVMGKYELLRMELDDARNRIDKGSLVQPAASRKVSVSPDRAAGISRARIVVSRGAPELLEVHIDLNYTGTLMQFRMIVDKKEQGRALILNDLLKDSNGELRFTVNTTGLAAGIYEARIEGVPFTGSAVPLGWLMLEVR